MQAKKNVTKKQNGSYPALGMQSQYMNVFISKVSLVKNVLKSQHFLIPFHVLFNFS